MAFPTLTPNYVYRDFEADMIPSSGAHHPKKTDIRRLLNEMTDTIIALIAGQGGSITLPNTVIRMTITGGTANAIVATPDREPPASPVSALFLIAINAVNTGPVTINGQPLRTNGGEDIAAGEIAANDFLLFIDMGDHYRLTMDTGSLRNKTAAQAAQVAAELARDFARRWASDPEDGPVIDDGVNPVGQSAYHWSRKSERARDIAAGYASDAVSQGNVPIYATVVGMPALEIPVGINAIRINGHDYAGDGRGGLAVDEDNGTEPWFITADGRTWWRAADVGPDRIVGPETFGGGADKAATVNDAAFIAYRAIYPNVELDLDGGTYLVSTVPSGPWRNGYFAVENFEGSLTALVPTQGTIDTALTCLAAGPYYAAWPQDKWHIWDGVIYAFWMEGSQHSTRACDQLRPL